MYIYSKVIEFISEIAARRNYGNASRRILPRRHFLSVTGFTLLEILIVVVIIGILASLAIPRYERTVEYSRGTEAIANLNILRGAELRFWGETGFETSNLNDLDVENPNLSAQYFTYDNPVIDVNTDGDFTIEATRQGGIYDTSWISVNQDGAYSGNWPFLP